MICRICFDDGNFATLVSPCKCIGTSQYIHRQCLDQYFTYYPDRICRVCRTELVGPMTLQDKALLAIGLMGLGVTLVGSTMAMRDKYMLGLTLLAITWYVVRNNYFNHTVAVGTLIMYITFIRGGHIHAVLAILVVVSCIAMVTTLILYVPVLYVIGTILLSTAFAYILIASIAFAMNSDSYALAVYMCILYLGWYAWIRSHPRLITV
jgi:hypothetical protein